MSDEKISVKVVEVPEPFAVDARNKTEVRIAYQCDSCKNCFVVKIYTPDECGKCIDKRFTEMYETDKKAQEARPFWKRLLGVN